MIIECPYCESKVDGKVAGEVEEPTDSEHPLPCKAILIACPICSQAILGYTEIIQTGPDDYEWSDLARVWPKQETSVAWNIPEIVRNSLIEAKQCFKVRAFRACAVMCGRTLEGICIHHSTRSKTLAKGLEELRAKKLIDERLYEWGDELRKHRNIGAHATTEKISKEDAQDLLDFTSAICEYVFILTEKFNSFKARSKKETKGT